MNKVLIIFISVSFTLIGAFLGAIGGAEKTSKAWRRLGISLLLVLLGWLSLQNWVAFTILGIFVGFTLGYGIPDPTDEGSTIGKFWFKLVKKDTEDRFNRSDATHLKTDVLTRLSVGLITMVGMLGVTILKGNWITFSIGTIVYLIAELVARFAKFKNFTIPWFGRDLLLLGEELFRYGVLTLACASIILF